LSAGSCLRAAAWRVSAGPPPPSPYLHLASCW